MKKVVVSAKVGEEALKKVKRPVGAKSKGALARNKRISIVLTEKEYKDVLRQALSAYTSPATWVRGVVAAVCEWNKTEVKKTEVKKNEQGNDFKNG
jgi:hypothetical protein